MSRNVLFYIGLFVLVFAVVLVLAQIIKAEDLMRVHISSPGAAGMHSSVDPAQLQPEQSPYLKNVDVTGLMGALRKRTRIVAWGDDQTRIDGAMQYWNRGLDHRGLLSLDYSDRSYIYTDDDPDDMDEVTVSQVFKPYIGAEHNFVVGPKFLIHCDGYNPPRLFTTGRASASSSGTDTIQKGARMYQIGLDAPGVPIVSVGLAGGDSSLTGTYQYLFHFERPRGYGGSLLDVYGGPGMWSRDVSPDGQHVIVSGFPFFPHPECSLTNICVWRREVYENGYGQWIKRLDTFYTWYENYGFTFTDSLVAGSDTGLVHPTDDGSSWDMSYTYPGALPFIDNGGRDADEVDLIGDSVMYYRISYYDPYLDIETPLGPPSKWADSAGSGQFITRFPCPDTTVRPPYIRVYRSLFDTSYVGGGDTSVMYGIYEYPLTDFSMDSGASIDWMSHQDVTDSQLANGCDSGLAYASRRLLSASGDALSRPPYEYANEIPFSDMEFVDDRYWGVGGQYKNRLYYSTNYDVARWNPDSNVIALDEEVNDEIVAIEPVGGLFKDHLYVFKRNSVYMVVGAIADYGFDVSGDTPYPFKKIADGIGAVSGKAVITRNGATYFLSTDMRIYRAQGNQIEDISRPIKDYIDSTYDSYSDAISYARAMAMQDEILFTNTSTGEGLAYNWRYGVWQVQDYTIGGLTLKPLGTVRYDTNSSSPGFDWYSDLLYFNTAIGLYERDRDERVAVTSGMSYQTPFFGDGEYNWTPLEAQLSVSAASPSRLRYYILNQDGEELWQGSNLFDTSSSGDLRIHFPPRFGKYVSVKFYTNANDSTSGDALTNDITIHDITLLLRPAGKTEVLRNEAISPPTGGDGDPL